MDEGPMLRRFGSDCIGDALRTWGSHDKQVLTPTQDTFLTNGRWTLGQQYCRTYGAASCKNFVNSTSNRILKYYMVGKKVAL
ncbi:MAG: hypothetical protein EOO38_08850 [Cytophagaceae bacterium]|nr:MAG: hypothetical protein EOO38_08850 [Cytophagaceae bacterium]